MRKEINMLQYQSISKKIAYSATLMALLAMHNESVVAVVDEAAIQAAETLYNQNKGTSVNQWSKQKPSQTTGSEWKGLLAQLKNGQVPVSQEAQIAAELTTFKNLVSTNQVAGTVKHLKEVHGNGLPPADIIEYLLNQKDPAAWTSLSKPSQAKLITEIEQEYSSLL